MMVIDIKEMSCFHFSILYSLVSRQQHQRPLRAWGTLRSSLRKPVICHFHCNSCLTMCSASCPPCFLALGPLDASCELPCPLHQHYGAPSPSAVSFHSSEWQLPSRYGYPRGLTHSGAVKPKALHALILEFLGIPMRCGFHFHYHFFLSPAVFMGQLKNL